jgi:hypothetical protein
MTDASTEVCGTEEVTIIGTNKNWNKVLSREAAKVHHRQGMPPATTDLKSLPRDPASIVARTVGGPHPTLQTRSDTTADQAGGSSGRGVREGILSARVSGSRLGRLAERHGVFSSF